MKLLIVSTSTMLFKYHVTVYTRRSRFPPSKRANFTKKKKKEST